MRTTHCLAGLQAKFVPIVQLLAAAYCVIAMSASVTGSEASDGLAEHLAILVDAEVISASDYWVPLETCETIVVYILEKHDE